MSTKEGKTDRILFQYSQFHAVFLASAVFLFIKNLKFDRIQKSEKICNIISKIASCTFGIYLIHMIINYYELKIFNINQNFFTFFSNIFRHISTLFIITIAFSFNNNVTRGIFYDFYL